MTTAPAEPVASVAPVTPIASVAPDAPDAPDAPTEPGAAGEPVPAALARAVRELSADLPDTDPGRVIAATLRGRHPGSNEAELRSLAIDAAAGLIAEEPAYSQLAARLLMAGIREEAAGQGVVTFTQSIAVGHRVGLISDGTAAFVRKHARQLNALVERAVRDGADDRFGYFGLRTVQSRYLLRHPTTRQVIETPQHFWLRVACGLADPASDRTQDQTQDQAQDQKTDRERDQTQDQTTNQAADRQRDQAQDQTTHQAASRPTDQVAAQSVAEVAELYRLTSSLAYLPSSPTLFNSGTRHPQMSSCYLLDSPKDELDSIYERYHQVARLSKHAGGIGLPYSRIRARGSLIRGTNGHSGGIVPFLRTLDSSVAAVNQGGRRKGAACVYLETWHADLEEFLELRDNTGEEARRTHNLNLAHWVPDEFMRRVAADTDWSLFSPADAPELVDLWGEEFDAAYRRAEAADLAVSSVPARQLYARMMRTLAQTGNGWMTFKDTANRTANQTAEPGAVVHSSNLCTEILEVTDDGETAVCNLGSINLAAHLAPAGAPGANPTADPADGPNTDPDDAMDWERLDATVRTAVTFLDRVVDINYYPTPQAADSNSRWRPVGLGLMGLQDVFFRLRLPFDSPAARRLSTRISERVMLAAYEASADLAERHGPHPGWSATRTARGVLHPDHYAGAEPSWLERWDALRARIARTGLRNALLLAIAPTATIASIAGVYECIEPQVSNLFKRETLSGEFLQVNTYLVADLKRRGRWDERTRHALRQADGSVRGLADILPAEDRELYRTAWEIPQRALIDMAADRTPYLDQSQSLNLFMAAPTIGKLSSMYAYAWKRGIKTTYYLRSRPATRIAQSARGGAVAQPVPQPTGGTASGTGTSAGTDTSAEGAACSLENPESCEACQ